MTSYQKLKNKCEYLQRQVDLFKNALTIVSKQEPIQMFNNDIITLYYAKRIIIKRNKLLDERIKEELNNWVAFNLDKETIERLLKLKEELKNDK